MACARQTCADTVRLVCLNPHDDGLMQADPPRFYRLPTIIGDSKATPPIPPLIPISRSAWWDGVAKGRFPAGIKIAKRVTVWRAEDIHALIQNAK